MNGCENCGGSCESCAGCGGALELNAGEISVLELLGQVAFLPVARYTDSVEPVLMGETALPSREYSLILQCLEKKGLIDIDYGAPLKNYTGYGTYPVRGSCGLTAKGQQVLELLEVQGLEAY